MKSKTKTKQQQQYFNLTQLGSPRRVRPTKIYSTVAAI